MVIKLKEYELYLRENEIAKNTIKNYLNTLNQLNQYCARKKIETISKEDMIDFKDYLKTVQYKPGRNYVLNTINQKLTAINIYLNWADESELKLKQFKQQTKTHRESINSNEYKRLLRFADDEMKLFILTIGNTGLRITELCSIKKIDLNSKIISIENKGKTRVVAIPQFLKKSLKRYSINFNDQDVLFPKTQSSYRARLKRIAGAAKVNKDKVYPHSIRHYFAKTFIENGGDSTELQQMLGHSNIATTTIYTKLSKDELGDKFMKIRNK